MSMNSRMLPQNKAQFGLYPMEMFVAFARKNVRWTGTFVANEGYHYDEEAKWNWLAPNLAVKTNQRTMEHAEESRTSHIRPTASNDGDWMTYDWWMINLIKMLSFDEFFGSCFLQILFSEFLMHMMMFSIEFDQFFILFENFRIFLFV